MSTPDINAQDLERAMHDAEDSLKEDVKKDKITTLLDLLKERHVLLFRDQFNEVYVAINGNGTDIRKLHSREFRQWLIKNYYDKTKAITNDATIKMAITLMECQASENDRIELHVRVARKDMVIMYDLGNGGNVRVDGNGWTVEREKTPILFRRFNHQTPQVEPEAGGNLDDLFNYINVKDDKDKILVKIYFVAAVIAGFPHPVITPHGDQGSAKSTLSKVFKRLIDPSSVDTIDPPDKSGLKEFIQTASHHWVLILDNVSHISGELSDVLARICTGAGHSKRILYSDDDDFVYNFQHIVGLNGINQVIRKPDLLNRSILLRMRKIEDHERMEEEEFWQSFNEVKPRLLGAIFDSASAALRYYPDIKLTSRPRMADFARWGCAIAKGLGYTENEFLVAYGANISEQNEEALEASVMAQVILRYVRDKMPNESIQSHQPTELLALLNPIAEELKVNKSHEYPTDATWLWRRILPVASDLESRGIRVSRGKGTDRSITIEKIEGLDTNDMEQVTDTTADTNAVLSDDWSL